MKNLNLNGYSVRIAVVALFALFLVACEKENKKPPISDSADLISIELLKEDNPSLTSNVQSFRAGNTHYLTVPEEISLESLKPKFLTSLGASVKVNGREFSTPPAAIDLSGVVKIEVISESGNKKANFTLLVKNGKSDIDQLTYSFMHRFSIPGVSVSMSKNGNFIYKSGYGFADVDGQVRTTPGHLFRLASISKSFTSVCIMKLYEQGKLSLSDKIFGDGAILADKFDPSIVSNMAARVNIQHLLEHTSGWVSNPDPMFTSSFKGVSLKQRVEYVLSSAQSEPGTKYNYFNMGYGILGMVIEELSGKKYEEFLKEVMLEAGVTDVHVGKDRAGKRANEVVYYSQDGYNGYGNEMDVIAAAGGVIASTEEMVKLLFHLDGKPGIPDILLPATRELMLTPSTVYNRYALGWRTGHANFLNSFYHTGNLAGTAVIWVMGEDVNVVVLCNSRSYNSSFDEELIRLASTIFSISSATS